MNRRLFFLYFLLILFLGCGGFALWCQFSTPAASPKTEEPYTYTQLQELAEIPATPSDEGKTSSYADIRYDTEALLGINDDFVGWLAVSDTSVSFPVVLGDDNSFYLRHAFDKAYNYYGCPFLDIRTPPQGDNLVVHGHNMGNNRTEIFSPLLRFQDPIYAKEHKTAWFSVAGEESQSQYELFAVVNFNLDSDTDYFVSEFEGETAREDYIRFWKSVSLYPSDFIPEGKILVLSTCNRTYGENNRLLLLFGQK